MREILSDLIKNIKPLDDLEKNHIADALAWVASGAELYRACSKSFVERKFQNFEWEIAKIEEEYSRILTRFSRFPAKILEFTPTNPDYPQFWKDFDQALIQGPDIPPKHMTAYGVLVDPEARKILLLDHIKAELWLSAGGHVERDEHPKVTVAREIQEELNIPAVFFSEEPFFLTEIITVGKTAGHMDVCFWYVLRGDSKQIITYDEKEFNGCRWFGFYEILREEKPIFDEHMKRFIQKYMTE